MPTASETQTLNWVLVAEGFALFTAGAGRTTRSVAIRILTAASFLGLAWAAGDESVSLLVKSIAALAAVVFAGGIVERWIPAGGLVCRATLAVAIGYRMLA